MDLWLGDLQFEAGKLPTHLTVAAGARVRDIALLDGSSTVQWLGEAPREVVWDGVLTGSDAGERARVIDGMREAGASVPFVCGELAFSVVIHAFSFRLAMPWWVPYRVSCRVASAGPMLFDEAVPETGVIAAGQANSLMAGASGLGVAGVMALVSQGEAVLGSSGPSFVALLAAAESAGRGTAALGYLAEAGTLI